MKLSIFYMSSITSQRIMPNVDLGDYNRRFFQLEALIRHHNPNFNVYKDFAYGCNCNLLATGGVGDRPLTQPGWGQAVDSLDVVCKAYKDCQKCAEEQHGETCIGEIVRYDYSMNGGNKATCNDSAGSCSRALCECDSTFALNHAAAKDEYNPQYSHYFAAFQYQTTCPQLCHFNEFELDNTGSYTENNSLDGTYTVTDNLVNGYKCYQKDDNLVVHENDVFGAPAWVVYNSNNEAVFFSYVETNCPRDAAWIFLPDGLNTVDTTNWATNIRIDGNTLPQTASERTDIDQQCCSSDTGPHLLFNIYSHFCCADGSGIRNMGNLC